MPLVPSLWYRVTVTAAADGRSFGVPLGSKEESNIECLLTHSHAVCVQGRQVFNLQYLHSKMNQCGPEAHIPQFQSNSVVSDLRSLNECEQYPGIAIVFVV